MDTLYRPRKFGYCLALASIALGSVAMAQGPGEPPPGGGPPPPPPGGPRVLTAANIPPEALQAGLKLTVAQQAQVAQIRQQLHERMRREMPPPGGRPPGARRGPEGRPGGFDGPPPGGPGGPGGPPPDGPGGPGGPPDPQRMAAHREKAQAAEREAAHAIEAALTATQRQSLPTLLAELQDLREVGIPLPLYAELKLTGRQKDQIAAIAQEGVAAEPGRDAARGADHPGPPDEKARVARRERETRAMSVLTSEQRHQMESFRATHPRPGPGEGFPPPPRGEGPPGPPPGSEGRGEN
jgi:Spy/CpxP family protein refolding chaperone